MKKFGFAVLAIFVGITAANAAPVGGDACALISGMKDVFQTLRTLAFVGAAFAIAGWAWGYISTGKIGEKSMEELKGKGVALLVGFALLFGIGMILQFLPGISGCSGIYGW